MHGMARLDYCCEVCSPVFGDRRPGTAAPPEPAPVATQDVRWPLHRLLQSVAKGERLPHFELSAGAHVRNLDDRKLSEARNGRVGDDLPAGRARRVVMNHCRGHTNAG